MKNLFDSQAKVYIEIKDNEGWFTQKYPENIDILDYKCTGFIKEKEVLLNLFELFTTLLDRLVQINLAYEEDPKVHLK